METPGSGNDCFPPSVKEEEIKYLLRFHLSVLSFIVIPLGNIIIPMILWLTKRDKNIDFRKQGTDLLNFQILWTLLFFASLLTFALINTPPEINNWTPLYIAGFLCLLNIIYPIVVSILISKSILKKYYYSLIKFIKL